MTLVQVLDENPVDAEDSATPLTWTFANGHGDYLGRLKGV
jgi:hypothetical protein